MTDQTPLGQAVDRVIDAAAATPARVAVSLVALPEALGVTDTGVLRFVQPAGVTEPRVFILRSDQAAWQAVILGEGTWELRKAPDDSLPPPAPPKIWLPS